MPFKIQWCASATGEPSSFNWSTPWGVLVIHTQGEVIIATDWSLEPANNNSLTSHEAASVRKLDNYWAQPDVPIDLQLLAQGTLFRQRVWTALCAIPLGTTLNYAALAHKIGSGARAVGNACRDNPYPLLVPCHRVVAAQGAGGYCGQTHGDFMRIKLALLAYERQCAAGGVSSC